jgi:WD40 repeat protein
MPVNLLIRRFALALAFLAAWLFGHHVTRAADPRQEVVTPKLPAQQQDKPGAAQPRQDLYEDSFIHHPSSLIPSRSPQPRLDLYGDPLPEGVIARLGSARFRFSFPDWIAFGSNGKELFAASQQGIILFDAATGRALRTFGEELHTTCWSSAVSADGKLAAIGGLEGSPSSVVYETATGKRLCELQRPNRSGTRLGGFSPDGSLLATMSDPSRVDLYESRTGKFIRSLQSKNENQIGIDYGDIAFMPDSKILLMSSRRTGVIHFLDVLSGQELGQTPAIPKGIAGMVLAPDGSRLAVLEGAPSQNVEFSPPGNRVMILDAQKGRLLTEFQSSHLSRQGMAFTHDSKNLFAGMDEKGIGIWDTTTGARTGTVSNTHGNDVWQSAIALSPDGKTIAYGDQASVRVCDSATGKELESHPGHSTRIASAALHPKNSTVATGGRDGRLLLWDRTTGRMLREMFKGSGWAQSAAYSADGKYLFAIVEFSVEPSRSSLRCWDLASGTEVWRLDNHPVQPGKLVIAPDGKMFAAIGHAAVVLIDSASGEPIRTLATEGEEFFLNGWVSMAELAFTADGSQLLAWGHKHGIHRWEIATGEHHVQACDHKIEFTYAVSFSPDRKQLLTGGVSDHFDLIDVASGKTIRTIKAVCKEDRVIVLGARFSPDGRTLAWSGPRDSIVRLTDVATGMDRRLMRCFNGRCVPLVYSNDGNMLVTGAIDGTALIWSLNPAK